MNTSRTQDERMLRRWNSIWSNTAYVGSRVVAAVVALSILFVVQAGGFGKAYYAFVYQIHSDRISEHITIEDKPHDCDWGRSPLGDKECHFEKNVVVAYSDTNPDVVTDIGVTWVRVED